MERRGRNYKPQVDKGEQAQAVDNLFDSHSLGSPHKETEMPSSWKRSAQIRSDQKFGKIQRKVANSFLYSPGEGAVSFISSATRFISAWLFCFTARIPS